MTQPHTTFPLVLVWLRRASADRDAQLDYVGQRNPSAAIKQGDRIAHQVEALTRNPAMGKHGRQQGTRELVISGTRFIVVYRVRGERIEVLRLLHSSQQWPK